ncbi:MAG: uroporphyrinogen-III synthase [Chromatiales bacterium]|jgi:uroporphyrinogen-III synthase|nr:uroporphyrinogen-III synthase [Chromatiales bacterium]MDX9767604.1 uroporphyrinogen-III synthase [Ectothiorhodospiraceae bacterium]
MATAVRQDEHRDDAGPLAGLGIVVTRPAHQADGFCSALEAAGAKAIRFPVLEILEPADMAPLLDVVARLDDFDLALFISPNAVDRALNLIHARRRLPPSMQIAAIGRKTARELERFGYRADFCPEQRFDSEALLADPRLADMQGRRVVIFRGDGGRELLAETFAARGAMVEYANCYRRGRPQTDVGELLRVWSRGEVHLVTVTSSEGLRNLFGMLGQLGQMWLRRTPLVVGSQRMRDTAAELGIRATVQVAEDPSDESMLKAVLDWAATKEANP